MQVSYILLVCSKACCPCLKGVLQQGVGALSCPGADQVAMSVHVCDEMHALLTTVLGTSTECQGMHHNITHTRKNKAVYAVVPASTTLQTYFLSQGLGSRVKSKTLHTPLQTCSPARRTVSSRFEAPAQHACNGFKCPPSSKPGTWAVNTG